MSNLDAIKELRTRTGAGIGAVKEALEAGKGDVEKAIAYLREKGLAKATKRAGKSADHGFIAHYIHGESTMAVLVELNAETDFAARNEMFRELARNIAVHIAAANPAYITVDQIPEETMAQEREIAGKGLEGRPEDIRNKIIDGKLEKFYEDSVLVKQRYVKDDSKTIEDLLNEAVAAIGEKIEIGRFCRMKVATPSSSCGI